MLALATACLLFNAEFDGVWRLDSGVVSRALAVRDGALATVEIAAGAKRLPLRPGEEFAIVLANGRRLVAADFRLVAAPLVEPFRLRFELALRRDSQMR